MPKKLLFYAESSNRFSQINLTAGARLADLPIFVLSTLEASSDLVEAALRVGEGWVGGQRKVMLGKGRREVELKGPS